MFLFIAISGVFFLVFHEIYAVWVFIAMVLGPEYYYYVPPS